MMKKFTVTVCLFLLFAIIGVPASAAEGDKKAFFDLTFADGTKTVADAGTDEAGASDDVVLTVSAVPDTLQDTLLRISFDSAKFRFENARVNTQDGKLTVLCAWDESYDNYVLLSVRVNTPLQTEEKTVELVTLTFSGTATADKDTSYAFSVSADGETPAVAEFGTPVSYTVSHVHDFTEWERYADATETEQGSDMRTCKTCHRTQYRQTGGVDYDITVRSDAEHIIYNAEKNCVCGIPAGTTAKELLASVDTTLSMQLSGAYPVIHDAKGARCKDGDTLKTGDTLALCGKSGKIYQSIAVAVIGDTDCSGDITAADARSALRFSVLLDTPTTAQSLAADCDGSAGVTAADARLILRVSVKLDAFYPVALESLKLSPSSLQMIVGDTEYLTVIYTPTDATEKAVTYKSSDTGVAVVKNGAVTAVGSGTATITVTGADNKTAVCTVNVQNVRFTREKYFVEDGGSFSLLSSLEYSPASALSKATMSLSDPNDFTVNTSGIVQCKTNYDEAKSKTTTLYLTLNTGRQLSAEIELIPAGASVCTFSMGALRLVEGDSSFYLNSTVTNSTETAVLSSSDSSVVAYDNTTGKLTPLKPGTAYITCTNTKYSERLKITVVKADNMLRLLNASKTRDSSTNAWNLRIQFANLSGMVIDDISFSVRPRDSAGTTLSDLATTVTASSVEPHTLTSAGVTFGWKGVWQSAADIDGFQIRMITVNYADGTVGYILGNGVKACAQ